MNKRSFLSLLTFTLLFVSYHLFFLGLLMAHPKWNLSSPLYRFLILGYIVGSLILFILVMTTAIKTFKRYVKSMGEVSDFAKRAMSDESDNSVYPPQEVKEVDYIGKRMNALVTRLRQQNAQLSGQKQQLRLLIDDLIIGVVMLDSRKRIMVVNQAFKTILGLKTLKIRETADQAIPVYRIVHLIEKAYEKKKDVREEITLFPQETTLDVDVIYVPEQDQRAQDGDRVLVLIYDVTESRHMEKMHTDFLANASHELKTPVTSLKGFSETLLDGALEDPETAREFVTIIYNESNRLEALIHDILDLVKMDQENNDRSEWLELNNKIEQLLKQFTYQAKEKKVHLAFKASDEAISIFCNPNLIDQILRNLISNAIKYNIEKGEVILTLKKRSPYVEITVSDTGIGIPKEDLSRIFERFYRVDKDRNTQTGGTGLGLSIVQNAVNMLNGTINVYSQYGQGTRFVVTLPIKEKHHKK